MNSGGVLPPPNGARPSGMVVGTGGPPPAGIGGAPSSGMMAGKKGEESAKGAKIGKPGYAKGTIPWQEGLVKGSDGKFLGKDGMRRREERLCEILAG